MIQKYNREKGVFIRNFTDFSKKFIETFFMFFFNSCAVMSAVSQVLVIFKKKSLLLQKLSQMKPLIFFLMICLFVSCQKDNLLFSDSYVFGDKGWGKDETVRFETEIQDSESTFRVNITIVHSEAYLYSNLLFSLVIITPDGAERTTDFEIFLKDDNRNFTGKQSEEQIEFVFDGLRKTSFFVPGQYIFILKHHMPFASVRELKELRIAIFKLPE